MLKKLLPKTKSKKKKEEAASSATPTLDRLHEVCHPRYAEFFVRFPCSWSLLFLCLCSLGSNISSVWVIYLLWSARQVWTMGIAVRVALVCPHPKKVLGVETDHH
jgi:hypothetical protein